MMPNFVKEIMEFKFQDDEEKKPEEKKGAKKVGDKEKK